MKFEGKLQRGIFLNYKLGTGMKFTGQFVVALLSGFSESIIHPDTPAADFKFHEHCTELVFHPAGKEIIFPFRERYLRPTNNLDGIQNANNKVVDTALPAVLPDGPDVSPETLAQATSTPDIDYSQ